MHLIDKDPMTPEMKAKVASSTATSTAETKKSSLGQALKNKIKGAKDAYKRGMHNYKNRKDDTNKYRSIFYWKDNTN